MRESEDEAVVVRDAPRSAATPDEPSAGEFRGDAPARDRFGDLAGISPPPGTTELGIDIIKVSRIADSLAKFGRRFPRRVLTDAEDRYVRDRPETFAGRWAAKEAVSKVLGLGVRGIGWRDIEIERLPTGQPSVRLHGRAAARADQLEMGRIAVSITHEAEYAVAIAFGVRTAGGRYVFPPDIEARLDDRERRILARMERMRTLGEEPAAKEPGGA
jgi:holo-[acyl-carrier-protein] synthase